MQITLPPRPHCSSATLPRFALQLDAPVVVLRNTTLPSSQLRLSTQAIVSIVLYGLRSDRGCSPGSVAAGYPASMTVCSLIIAHQHQTSRNSLCFGFRVMLTNGQQRLQVPILSFRCPHSLCNAVGGQHSPRKPRRGAGRNSTTPDTSIVRTPIASNWHPYHSIGIRFHRQLGICVYVPQMTSLMF